MKNITFSSYVIDNLFGNSFRLLRVPRLTNCYQVNGFLTVYFRNSYISHCCVSSNATSCKNGFCYKSSIEFQLDFRDGTISYNSYLGTRDVDCKNFELSYVSLSQILVKSYVLLRKWVSFGLLNPKCIENPCSVYFGIYTNLHIVLFIDFYFIYILLLITQYYQIKEVCVHWEMFFVVVYPIVSFWYGRDHL